MHVIKEGSLTISTEDYRVYRAMNLIAELNDDYEPLVGDDQGLDYLG